ncbi:MAG: thermonuclease family protein [Anaerolineaceae bacterium]|nr:thermonuclease family protein [Anaerolineaceae bacterium]
MFLILLLMFLALFTATEEQAGAPAPTTPTPTPPVGEQARVLRVIDGDTIEVSLNRRNRRVRYIGINTPERDEPCSNAATAANRRLVGGRDVTLVRGAEETDRYGRLLRYIYADGVFVNEALVREGFAENFVWEPNTRFVDRFRALEAEAQSAGRGCHPSGVFDDGDTER